MKRIKKCIVLFMCMILFVQGIMQYPISDVQAAETDNGVLSLSAEQVHKTDKAFEKIPLTFDAEIQITAGDKETRGGIIMGSYQDDATDAFSFEVLEEGVPALSFIDNGTYYTYKFADVDVRSIEPVRLTIVKNLTSAVCYIDGEVKQTVTQTTDTVDIAESQAIQPANEAVVGGDLRSKNSYWFKGTIRSLNVWADVRTSDEVSTAELDTTDENLIAAYDFRTGVNPENDLSGNGYDLSGELNIGFEEDGVYTNTDLTQGLDFSYDYRYESKKEIISDTYTLSSWVYLPKEENAEAHIVLGNYYKRNITCFDFVITEDGVPQLFHINTSGEQIYITFPNADVRRGEWTHFAITVDATTGTVTCYLNGILKGSVTTSKDITLSEADAPYALGSDQRYNNIYHFQGRILETALYKTVLTADEIKKAYLDGVDADNTNLVGLYNLSTAQESDDIVDLSANDNDMYVCDRYFSEKEEVTDYAYSFAVVGDTQKLTYEDCMSVVNNKNDSSIPVTNNLEKVYDWIVDNKDNKKIEYVFGLGDITDMDWVGEWEVAQEAISKLDGQIDYSLIRGNHDKLVVDAETGDVRDRFSTYMGTEAYKAQFANDGGFMDDANLSNSWRTIKIGNVNYLMLNLDWHLEDDVIAWADKIISDYPNHNVILTTHVYLGDDGKVLSAAADGGTNTSEYLWENLVSKHDNIVMVLSGHVGTDNIVMNQQKGKNGNIVTSFLIDPQEIDKIEGPTGMVAMFYFSEDGKHVQVEYISTIRNEYFLESNQFKFELAVVDDEAISRISASEVQTMMDAKEAPTGMDGTIFAGWYKDAEFTQKISTTADIPKDGAFAKFVDEDVMSVKLQSQKINGATNLRIVTSVDTLDYENVGFDIVVGNNEKTFNHETTGVSERINATEASGVRYDYSPKIIDVDSQYFTTLTITGIPDSDLDKTFNIKPYWTTFDGTKVYGISRCVSINTGNASDCINVAVKLSDTTTLTEGGTITPILTHYGADGAATHKTTNANVLKVADGIAHLNISVTKADLHSATQVKLPTGEVTIYRNLTTSYNGDASSVDNSWYYAYKAIGEAEKYVVTTNADLYGLATLAKNHTFANQTLYVIADIKANNDTAYEWTPIGTTDSQFVGNFDGQGHTISGISQTTTETGVLGMFGYIADGALIEDMRLDGSSFKAAGQMGSIVAQANGGTIQEVYSAATMENGGSVAGGIVGKISGDVKVSNCWFDGSVNMTTDAGELKAAGIVGSIDNASATVEHCQNSGAITSVATADTTPQIGGLVGSVEAIAEAESTVAIGVHDSLNTGVISTGGATTGVATLIGYDASGVVTLKNNYATVESCGVDTLKGVEAGLYQVVDVDITTANLAMITVEGTEGYTDVKGTDAFSNMTLQFAEYWSAVTDGTPMLTSFVTDEAIVTGEIHVAIDKKYDADGLEVVFKSGDTTINGLVDAGNYITMIAKPGEYEVSTSIYGVEKSLESVTVVKGKKEYDAIDLGQVFADTTYLDNGTMTYDFATSSVYYHDTSNGGSSIVTKTLPIDVAEITGAFSVTARYKIDESEVIAKNEDGSFQSENIRFGMRAFNANKKGDTVDFYKNTAYALRLEGWSSAKRLYPDFGSISDGVWTHSDYSRALTTTGLWVKMERDVSGIIRVYFGTEATSENMTMVGSYDAYVGTDAITQIAPTFTLEKNAVNGFSASIENINVSVAQNVEISLSGKNCTAEDAIFTFTPQSGTPVTGVANADNRLLVALEPGTYEVSTMVYGVEKSLGTITIVKSQEEYDPIELGQVFADKTYLDNGTMTYDFATSSVYYSDTADGGAEDVNKMLPIDVSEIAGAFSVTAKYKIAESEILAKNEDGTLQAENIRFGMRAFAVNGKGDTADIYNNANDTLRVEGWGSKVRIQNVFGTLGTNGEWTPDNNGYYEALTTTGLWIKMERSEEGTLTISFGTGDTSDDVTKIGDFTAYSTTENIAKITPLFALTKTAINGYSASIENIQITDLP